MRDGREDSSFPPRVCQVSSHKELGLSDQDTNQLQGRSGTKGRDSVEKRRNSSKQLEKSVFSISLVVRDDRTMAESNLTNTAVSRPCFSREEESTSGILLPIRKSLHGFLVYLLGPKSQGKISQ